MRRLILSPLVGLMMGGACALGVFGIGEGLWAMPSAQALALRVEPVPVSPLRASILIAGECK